MKSTLTLKSTHSFFRLQYYVALNIDAFAAKNIQRLTDCLDGLPTNNCINERDLSKFDKEAILSKCRNRWFKAKSIRNNMVLYKSLCVVAWQETNAYLWYEVDPEQIVPIELIGEWDMAANSRKRLFSLTNL